MCGVIGSLGVLFCVGVLVSVCSVVIAGGCVVTAVVGGGVVLLGVVYVWLGRVIELGFGWSCGA